METVRELRARSSDTSTTDERRSYLSRDRWSLAAAAGFTLVLFAASWYRHATYRSNTYDMAVFDQALWLLAHGHAPYVTVIGRNIFLDHFSPVLLLFVPFYLIASTPLWLLAAQSLALGAGLLTLGPLLDEIGVTRPWRIAFTVAYVFSLLVWNAALYDFHPTTLAVPFLLAGITAALRDDPRHLIGNSVALLLLRDDLGLAVVALALVGIRTSARRQLRFFLVAVGVAWVLIGASFGKAWHSYYSHLGPSASWILLHFWAAAPKLFTALWREDVLRAVVIWLLTLGLLPLLSPGRMLLAFVWALPLFAAGSSLAPGGLDLYHYGALVFPFFVLASGFAITRLPSRLRTRAFIWLLAFSAMTFGLYSHFGTYSPLGVHIVSIQAPDRAVANEALKLIKPGDGVSATNTLAPHLSHRSLLLPFPYPFARGAHAFPLAAAVTVVSASAAARIDSVAIFVANDKEVRAFVAAFERLPYVHPFRLVFNEGGVLIYRRLGT